MKLMDTKTWQGLKFLGNLQANANLNACAYVLSESNEKEDKYHHDIWIYQKNRHFQLTNNHKASNYTWLDHKHLVFSVAKDEGKGTDVFKISIMGGEATLLFTTPLMIQQLKVLNDQQFLIIAGAHDHFLDIHKATPEELEKFGAQMKENDYYQEINQLPFYFNGGSFISNQFKRLYVYDVQASQLKPISNEKMDVQSIELHPNLEKALVLLKMRGDVITFENDMYELNLKNFKLKKLTQSNQMIGYATYLKDGIFGFVKELDGPYGMNQNSTLGKFNRKAKQFETIIDPIYSIGNSINSDIRLLGSPLIQVFHDVLYFTLNVRDHSRLMKFDGKHMEMVLDFEGSLDGYTFLGDKLITLGLQNQEPQALYHHKKKLTKHNDFIKDYDIITPLAIDYEVDNRPLRGWVMLPPKFSSKKKYPAILNIHGGPKTIYGEVFINEMQVWAQNGYVVMYTNPSGSDGQDNAFSDVRGKYGTIDYDDLMGFFEHVLETYPNIDPDKCGVTGGSYGGFMTNWIIGHTQRFACAITQRSISNWTSFYGVSDIGHYFTTDQQQATLQKAEDIDKLWWHSPIKYLPNMKTPTLIIHSLKDYRCPVDQGYQLFSGLKEKKVDTKMILFNHENHDLSRTGKVKARQKRLDEMLGWFDHYLK